MKTFTTLVALFLLLPLTLQAQEEAPAYEEPGFLMFNQNLVQGEDMETLNRNTDSLLKPVLDGMVEEGLIANWGILTHAWGDEWNWNWYIFAKDHASFTSAWSEFVNRVIAADSNAFPAVANYLELHKDNMYQVRHHKLRPPAEGENPPGFAMLNQHKVHFQHVGATNALFDSTGAVVLNEMLAEGLIYFWGQATHAWGDEWNWNFWFGSDNHADFVADWNEYVNRLQERFPETWEAFSKYSKAHKDNLYVIRYAR